MENRCGGEKERKREKDEERREEEKKRWMLLPVRLKSKMVFWVPVCDVCVSIHLVYTVFKTYCVCVNSCRDSDWVGGCRSLSSRVVPSVLESDSGHLLF